MADNDEPRGGRNFALPLLFVTLVLVTLFLSAGIVVVYERQSDRVFDLERANEKIESDHLAIGAQFAKQNERLEEALAKANERAQELFARGYLAGRRARAIPRKLAALERYAADGFLVPRRLPGRLGTERARVSTQRVGYSLRWREISVFANKGEPLSIWTRQGWPGSRSTVRIGPRTVNRILGPFGVIFAWRERGGTYAVLSYPHLERAIARPLVAGMQ